MRLPINLSPGNPPHCGTLTSSLPNTRLVMAVPILSPPLAFGAAIHVVGRKPDETRHNFGKRQFEAVAFLA
jgi:hypothetical protein